MDHLSIYILKNPASDFWFSLFSYATVVHLSSCFFSFQLLLYIRFEGKYLASIKFEIQSKENKEMGSAWFLVFFYFLLASASSLVEFQGMYTVLHCILVHYSKRMKLEVLPTINCYFVDIFKLL